MQLWTMNIDWQPLDLNNIPAEPGVYGWQWRGQWLYIGESINLKRRLNASHTRFELARSLSDAEFFWIPTEAHRKVESIKKKEHMPWWNNISGTIMESGFGLNPQCFLPGPNYALYGWLADP